jgi:hypothetical protein
MANRLQIPQVGQSFEAAGIQIVALQEGQVRILTAVGIVEAGTLSDVPQQMVVSILARAGHDRSRNASAAAARDISTS